MRMLRNIALIICGLGLAGNLFASEDHDHAHEAQSTHKHHNHEGEQHEERTQVNILREMEHQVEITSVEATGGELHERIKLYGSIVADPLRLSHIQARYPGLIREVKPAIGTRVSAGDVLATIESNESLRQYPLLSPIDGTVVERHANAGEFSADRILFTVLDERVLELHLQAFPADASKVKTGQSVIIDPAGLQTQTVIEYITPRFGDTPTLEVHAPVDNSAGHWVPNQAVEAWITLAKIPVALRVENQALHQIEGLTGVFVKDALPENAGDVYTFRALSLGRNDGIYSEVLNGLTLGEAYALDNSYILKADLEKSGAAHEH